ncbi:VIT1/CCC1 transporter family protein [Haloarchaeobius sp. DYHT-AS-18]|uniref:VIT1/CCC1 transporter family protein n=1 Tax=Haloarchaeobius sp. DYHT-AS-18 TaxID=3446117 RepID=UPI003EB9E674
MFRCVIEREFLLLGHLQQAAKGIDFVIVVIPYFALSGFSAVGASLLLSTVALFGVGAAITVLTGRSVLYSGTRQVVTGLAAAGLTYGVGTLIGVSLAG